MNRGLEEHYEYLSSASCEVDLSRDKEGRYHARCYDSHGYYIGGTSNTTLERAQRAAYRYAQHITSPIPHTGR